MDRLNDPNNGGIYAILDVVANMLIGMIYIHRNEAAAIRFFSDLAADPQTIISKHLEDFELIRLGYLDTDNSVLPYRESILTGKQLAATRRPAQEG